MDADFLADVLHRLGATGAVRSRRMFGGAGLYRGDLFFGLVAGDRLFLRADAGSIPALERAGSEPFQPFADKPSMRTYWSVPERVLTDRELLAGWSARALQAARAAAARKQPQRRRSAPSRGAQAERIENLGPVSRRWLAEVGVHDRAELERRGSVRVYQAVAARGHRPSLNLLYALEAALLGLRWDRLPEIVRANLRERVGRTAPPSKTRRRR